MPTIFWPGAGCSPLEIHDFLTSSDFSDYDTFICLDGMPDSKYWERPTVGFAKFHGKKFLACLNEGLEKAGPFALSVEGNKRTYRFTELNRTLIYFINTSLPLREDHPAFQLAFTAEAYYMCGYGPETDDPLFWERNVNLQRAITAHPWSACVKSFPLGQGVTKWYRPVRLNGSQPYFMKDVTGERCHPSCSCVIGPVEDTGVNASWALTRADSDTYDTDSEMDEGSEKDEGSEDDDDLEEESFFDVLARNLRSYMHAKGAETGSPRYISYRYFRKPIETSIMRNLERLHALNAMVTYYCESKQNGTYKYAPHLSFLIPRVYLHEGTFKESIITSDFNFAMQDYGDVGTLRCGPETFDKEFRAKGFHPLEWKGNKVVGRMWCVGALEDGSGLMSTHVEEEVAHVAYKADLVFVSVVGRSGQKKIGEAVIKALQNI